MSKELEAFDRVWEDCSKLDLDYVSKHNLMDDLREIKKALTPPTADEVCEALSEYLQRKVNIYSDNTFYYTEQRQIGECDEIICGYGWENEHHTIAFEIDLPPNLITLIGRFYEGVEKVGKEDV